MISLESGQYVSEQMLEPLDETELLDWSEYYDNCPWTVTTSEANIVNNDASPQTFELKLDVRRAD